MKKKIHNSQFVQYELSKIKLTLTENNIGMRDPRDNLLVNGTRVH
jgi:hypothetical protein